jgi:hypothetical protein
MADIRPINEGEGETVAALWMSRLAPPQIAPHSQLLGGGIEAGAIEDGAPGPRQEMCRPRRSRLDDRPGRARSLGVGRHPRGSACARCIDEPLRRAYSPVIHSSGL